MMNGQPSKKYKKDLEENRVEEFLQDLKEMQAADDAFDIIEDLATELIRLKKRVEKKEVASKEEAKKKKAEAQRKKLDAKEKKSKKKGTAEKRKKEESNAEKKRKEKRRRLADE